MKENICHRIPSLQSLAGNCLSCVLSSWWLVRRDSSNDMVLRYCVIIKTTLIAYVIMLMRLLEHLCTVTVCGSNEQRVHEASSLPASQGPACWSCTQPHWIWPTGGSKRGSKTPFEPGLPSPSSTILHVSVGGEEPWGPWENRLHTSHTVSWPGA